MIIKYEFITGETVKVEVDENIGEVIVELDRSEYNNDKKETRRHCTLNVLGDDGEWLIDRESDPCTIKNLSKYGVEDERLDDAMDNLTEEEREAVFAVYGSGYTRKAYSEIISIPRTTVNDYVTRGKKKIKKFY